jgi:hypothetical protein
MNEAFTVHNNATFEVILMRQFLRNILISVVSFFFDTGDSTSQTSQDQELDRYAYFRNSDETTVFFSMLTNIDTYRAQFPETDFVVLQDESRLLLQCINQKWMDSFTKLAHELIKNKHVVDIKNIDVNELAQSLASHLQQQETLISIESKASLQRTLSNLSPPGQAVLQTVIISGNAEKQLNWQKMADEAPGLLNEMYGGALMQRAYKSDEETVEKRPNTITGSYKAPNTSDTLGFEVNTDGEINGPPTNGKNR